MLSTFTCASYGGETSPASMAKLKLHAEEARSLCAQKIHFDTYAFERCIDELAKKSGKDNVGRLGIEYAGFAIALSTTRVGMEGAEGTAQHFYWRYRPLQKKLGIDDASLCTSLPGDCRIRVAQSIALSKGPKPKTSAASQKQTLDHDH